jgi:MFS family permease
MSRHAPDSRYAWWRLAIALAAMTLGSSAMYVVAVVLPAAQAEFGVARADASLPYTLLMIGFGLGGLLMGRLADRFGVAVVLAIGAAGLASGFVLAAHSEGIVGFAIVHGLLLGAFGSACTFAPLVADTALWFVRRRGIAVAVCASGNYLAGAIWPPLVQWGIEHHGWRDTYTALGLVCGLGLAALVPWMRERPPALNATPGARPGAGPDARPFGLAPTPALVLLCIAGVACCVAMAMPQVHIVAYCGDLGYGVARGAEMLSIMLACGIVSRIASGFIADRIGGLRTLLLGSVLQGISLSLFLFFDGMAQLYVLSALFGLMQGGIVPSYAVIVREHFPAKEVGTRVGIVLFATLIGMAGGGWVSGLIFDMTGSYAAAFLNGVAWNAANVVIVTTLLLRAKGMTGAGPSRLPA